MGRLICSMMDFEEEMYGDILVGVKRYKDIHPEEYYWVGEEDISEGYGEYDEEGNWCSFDQ